MWRTQAVARMLLEDIAGLGRSQAQGAADGALRDARRSAWRAILLDWAAIAVLLALRAGETPLLPVGPTVEIVFTCGLLLVAAHSGFRLGQLEKLRAVGLLVEELEHRSAP